MRMRRQILREFKVRMRESKYMQSIYRERYYILIEKQKAKRWLGEVSGLKRRGQEGAKKVKETRHSGMCEENIVEEQKHQQF